MTKQEAIAEMKKGVKITHKSFTDQEWMTITGDGKMKFEDDVQCSEHEFWHWRKSAYWNEGYLLFNK